MTVYRLTGGYPEEDPQHPGGVFRQVYSKGIPLGDVKKVDESDRSGTVISFSPDFDIMVVCKIDCSTTKLFSVPLRMIALLYDGIAFPKLMRDLRWGNRISM